MASWRDAFGGGVLFARNAFKRCVFQSVTTQSVFFFFSSRRRHTRCGRDWSSDVCSSDLQSASVPGKLLMRSGYPDSVTVDLYRCKFDRDRIRLARSEERRVGKEWRSRWSPYDLKKKRGGLGWVGDVVESRA